ncbi:MAG: hypothetical protein ABSH50_09315 [Bryobacteraceae bacterium]
MPALARIRHRLIPYLAISLAVLTPCFWQKRIQAGDLSSHIYNAWLAGLIEQGRAEGLTLVPQTHNVLFDLLLSALLRAFGPGPAQRIAVSAAVLVFFWGAFAFVWRISRRGPAEAPWEWTPCLAMLAYGWVFHMGLFNFYISLGLALWSLAAAPWRTRRGLLTAALLWIPAYVAHLLPVVWAVGVTAYLRLARAIPPRYRAWLAGAAVAAMALSGLLLKLLFHAQWTSGPNLSFTGADQFWVFGERYLPLALAVLLLWVFGFQAVLRRRGPRRTLLDARLHLCILNAACIQLLPSVIVLPASGQAESLLIGRMSLAGAVLYAALAATARQPKWLSAGMSAAAAVFFIFIYQDAGALNRVEDRMEHAVAQLPPGQRVVSALMDTNLREFSLLHIVDRVCVGRCFSYANYEPSVGQFRVRAERPNHIVTADFRESWAMQAGGYVVQPRDLPLYRIDLCSGAELCASPVAAGVALQRHWLRVTPDLWKAQRGEE